MELSVQQKAVIAWALEQNGSANVVARAGTGKTTLLLALVDALMLENPNTEIFLGAYNKAIATELQQRLKDRGYDWRKAQASTLHSAGYSAWRRIAPKVEIDRDKIKNILAKMVEEEVRGEVEKGASEDKASNPVIELIRGNEAFLSKLVSFAKQRAFGFLEDFESHDAWFAIIEHFGLDEILAANGDSNGQQVDIRRLIDIAMDAFEASMKQDRTVIDFDDMILAPLVHNAKVWPKDWVLIDEAQDTNPARRALAMKMLGTGGRLVAVGDPAQAIYGFTGADSDSMDIIAKQLGSVILPLTVTYRCPKNVVALAQTWVSDIQADAKNADGVVRVIRFENMMVDPGHKLYLELKMGLATGLAMLDPARREGLEKQLEELQLAGKNLYQTINVPFWRSEQLRRDDVVLCRLTAPLIDLAMRLIVDGIGCRVEGRDIGEGLVKLTTRWKSITDLTNLSVKLHEFRDAEIQKWVAKGKPEKAESVEDRVNTLITLIGGLTAKGKHGVNDAVAFIRSLFGDLEPGQKPNVLTLSTVHKSKGREWDRVFLLGRNAFMPSKWARKEWQKDQERNLQYVAVTRAKQELVEIMV